MHPKSFTVGLHSVQGTHVGFGVFVSSIFRFTSPTPVHLVRLQVRAMVLGKNGEVIGKIGIAARVDLEVYLDRRVHLILNVKVARKKGGS